jgi:hypothetical protein
MCHHLVIPHHFHVTFTITFLCQLPPHFCTCHINIVPTTSPVVLPRVVHTSTSSFHTSTCHHLFDPTWNPYSPCVICIQSIQCHVSHPGGATCPIMFHILLVGQNLENIITYSYDVYLRLFKLGWKDIIKIYANKSFSLSFQTINF